MKHSFSRFAGTAAALLITLSAESAEAQSGGYIVRFSPKALSKLRTEAVKTEAKKVGRPLNSTSFAKKAVGKKVGARRVDFLTRESLLVDKGENSPKLDALRRLGIVRYVEPNYVRTASAVPTDFWYKLGLQWGLHNTGQSGGKPDVDIDAPEAWDLVSGSPNVVVAVVDTGIQYKHPDLAPNTWTNRKEVANNRVDDDGNGLVDDVHGYDFANGDSDPIDDNFHGTHVAGIIGARGNNGRGVAGVSWSVQLMALKVLKRNGAGDDASLLKAIDYAISQKKRGVNIRVINASLGGPDNSRALKDSIAEANSAGILFVAAAGNSTVDIDQTPTYPASYDLPNLVSVAAVAATGKLSSFSNYGRKAVHVAAPGSLIFSTIPGNFYLPLDGTSMAAPFVAGIAALVSSKQPGASPAQLKSILMNAVKPLPGLEGKMQSPGIVSAYRALSSR